MVYNPYNPYNDSYLAHYGVKGMKWGVRRQRRRAAARKDRNAWRSMSKKERKANRDKYNKRYSKDDRDADKATYGSGGVKRINRRMNKGQSYARAYLTEAARTSAIGTGVSVAALAGLELYSIGPQGRRAVANSLKYAAATKVADLLGSVVARNYQRQARNMIPRLVADNAMNNVINLKPWQYKVR